MKRKLLLRHLEKRGCFLIREGGRHSIYFNPINNRTSAIPRHIDINDFLTEKICKDLGVPRRSNSK